MSYRKVTLGDVAAEAGVSKASASAVIAGKNGGTIRISPETRDKVISAAEKLGYVPNQTARNLRGDGGGLIAVFTYEKFFPAKATSEFYGFFSGIEQEAQRRELDLLIVNDRKKAAASRITMAGGAIMIGVDRDDSDIRSLIRQDFPLVFVGRREIAGEKTSWVTFDYEGIIRKVFDSIPSSTPGIVFIESGEDTVEPVKDKRRFVLEGTSAHNLPLRSFRYCEELPPEAETLMKEGWFVLISRIWMADRITSLCRSLDVEPFGFLLEDNWMNIPLVWNHWTNERETLGALSVSYLTGIMKGENPSVPPLVELKWEDGLKN